jgi:hypothetical protein
VYVLIGDYFCVFVVVCVFKKKLQNTSFKLDKLLTLSIFEFVLVINF